MPGAATPGPPTLGAPPPVEPDGCDTPTPFPDDPGAAPARAVDAGEDADASAMGVGVTGVSRTLAAGSAADVTGATAAS